MNLRLNFDVLSPGWWTARNLGDPTEIEECLVNHDRLMCFAFFHQVCCVMEGVLRDVFGKRGRDPSDIEQAFRRMFPGVWTFVRKYNRDDHGNLLRTPARRVQTLATGSNFESLKK